MPVRRPIRPLAAVLPVLVAATAARGQDAPPPAPAPVPEPAPPAEKRAMDEAVEVLVTATRRDAAGFDVPWMTDVIDDDEMRGGRMPRTLPDALADVPGVMIQKTSYGQASPFMRGFTGYHTVLLVDGIRLNNSTFRSGPNQYWGTVDAYSAERLEAVKGASSVLYGSDAVGGAVNAVARRRHTFEPGSHFDVRSITRMATAEHSRIYRLEAEGNQDDLGVAVGATYKGFGDLEAGHETGELHGTGYREKDGDLRIDWRQAPGAVWTFGAQVVEQDAVPRTHTTVDSESFHGTSVGDELRRDLDQDRSLVYLRHARDLTAAFADHAEVTLSWQEQRERQHRDRTGERTDIQGYDVNTWGLQVELEKATSIGDFTYGVEYWRDDVTSFRRNYVGGAKTLDAIQGPVADDASYDLLGVYAQDEVRFGATTVTAGGRFTYAAADADRVDDPTVSGNDPSTPGNVISLDDSWNNFVGSLRAVHPVCDDLHVFGGASQGFRAPNLSDLTRLDDTSGVETPSLGLDPEEFLQYEAGVKLQDAAWSFAASFFHTEIDDLIVPSPTGGFVGSTPEVRKDNVGDGYVRGVEVEGAWRVNPSWTVTGAGTWQRGEIDQLEPSGREVTRPLSRVMPMTGVLTVAWRQTPKSPLAAWISGKASAEQDRLSLKDETDTQRIPPGGTPGWFTWSFGASYDVGENATLAAALENVGDVDYRIHGSGVDEPGRNLIVSLTLRF
jgi:hemoglobin/transferrin/lactoferrin receptor protein